MVEKLVDKGGMKIEMATRGRSQTAGNKKKARNHLSECLCFTGERGNLLVIRRQRGQLGGNNKYNYDNSRI